MKVETFELTDVKLETPEQSAEALALCEELGMSAQLKLIAPTTDGSASARFPYRILTDEENFVYRTLCPEVSQLKDYRNETIPLEVLRAIKHARDAGIETFEIWSASSRIVKDPVVIGKKSTGSWSSVSYLIARWGDELMPLEVLLPDAINRFNKARTAKLQEIKAQVEAALALGPIVATDRTSMPYLSL